MPGHFCRAVYQAHRIVRSPITVKPATHQIDDLLNEIDIVVNNNERVLVTTLTKRMAEELAKYLTKLNIRCRYIHSDIETLDRIDILEGLRKGTFDVLIGVNLLREGLDLPEVSLVAILDADKEGFLRSERSLTQVAGRAARNIHGKVIMYADKITRSMKLTIELADIRREKQVKYNMLNNITPRQIIKPASSIMANLKGQIDPGKAYIEPETTDYAADPVVQFMTKEALIKAINKARLQMEKAAKALEFIEAARYRDEVYAMEKVMYEKFK